MKHIPAGIMLMTDGTRTVAEATLTDIQGPGSVTFTGAGSSGRERGDKRDDRVGEWLATARALRSMAAHLERQAQGRVRHAEEIKRHRAEIAEKNTRFQAPEPRQFGLGMILDCGSDS